MKRAERTDPYRSWIGLSVMVWRKDGSRVHGVLTDTLADLLVLNRVSIVQNERVPLPAHADPTQPVDGPYQPTAATRMSIRDAGTTTIRRDDIEFVQVLGPTHEPVRVVSRREAFVGWTSAPPAAPTPSGPPIVQEPTR